ncbi:ribonuclease Y [Candidatus Shapirobacteria bacterium]|nr:ribonuclease Y [Candidatus Shapirobacteria bacterium]
MGLFDSLLTKIIDKEEEEGKAKGKGKKTTGKKEKVSSEGKLLAKELALKIAELERKDGALTEREKLLKDKEEDLTKVKGEIEEIRKKEIAKLEKISALTKQEARELILTATEKRIAEDIARKIKEAEEEVKAHADEKAKEILIEAIRHGVTDWVAEYTVSSVHLPDEEMKGRIIGREGRNIRTFERATGVEIEIDETNDIRLSSFDPVRREIARRSIEKLIKDRRIQPSRIEEIIEKTKQEVEKIMLEEGEKLCHAVQVYRLHPDLIKLLGRYKFRFSYGQNMIVHTLEETKIGVQLASELGANVNVVRLGCLLHDVGKVVTEEEGTHVQLGVDLARKYRLPEEVVTCIAEHHEDKPFSSLESRIVWVADAASGSRPGARYEPHEEYVERMSQIEQIASEFPEVEEAFAYQAGRDVRVLVKPEKVSDDELVVLASKITKTLEEKASYAGQIKVTCIRETRASEVTKAK